MTIIKNLIMRYMLLAALALLFASCTPRQQEPAAVPQEKQECLEYGIPVDRLVAETARVERGDFFTRIMEKIGVGASCAYELSAVCDTVFDLSKIKVGNAYVTYYSNDSIRRPEYWRYDRDASSYAVLKLTEPYEIRIEKKQLEVKTKYSEVVIDNSLWYDVQQAGVSTNLALEISDVFQWTIDFFGLQKGDGFKVLYDEVSFEGDVCYIDKIHYCVFEHAGESNYAFWYDQGDGSSGKYWNEKGESLRKAFLKAPLKFSRISSTFSYARMHPVHRVVRPHTGVDYAAPMGTPVHAVGDGVVIMKGFKKGNGNTVKIKHNSVYTTAYLHLSKYGPGIRNGVRVKQGQVIGYVGSTGYSTGPHLDYRIWKNGTPINPLTMKSPSVEPIKEENRAEFQTVVDRYMHAAADMVVLQTVEDYLELL